MPFCRYQFNHLPFGVTSAQEYFQEQMTDKRAADLEVVFCHINNILVFERNQQEHNEHLKKVLKKIQNSKLTLSLEEFICFLYKERSRIDHV